MEPKGRGVLDPPLSRRMTSEWEDDIGVEERARHALSAHAA